MHIGGKGAATGGLLRGEAAIAAAIGLMNVSTYGFTLVAATVLGPRPYGAFAGLMATLWTFVVPILAIADEDGETARMLRQVGGHYVVAGDSATPIAAALREAVRRRDLPSGEPPSDVLREWLTERQMRLLVAAVSPDRPPAALSLTSPRRPSAAVGDRWP